MAIATLATTRYVEVGTYIGQFFIPGTGSLPNEARVVCLVGRGDRNIIIHNNTIRRSFVYDEQLTFSTMAPFIAPVNNPTDGNQSSPTSLRTTDGVEISPNKWSFLEHGGAYDQVQLLDSVYDPMAQYYLSYQSTSREVLDPIPAITVQSLQAVAEVREIQALGLLQDQDEFVEYTDYIGEFELDPMVGSTGNANPSTNFSPINATGASGTGLITVNTGAMYSHQYNRVYSVECTGAAGVVGTRTADFKWTSTPVSYGNAALPSVPLSPSEPEPTFSIDEASVGTLTQILDLGLVLDFAFGGTNFIVGDIYYLQGNGPGLVELDPKLLNDNQFTEFSSIVPDLQLLSTGSVSFDSLPNDYIYTEHNLTFRLKVVSATSVTPTRQAVVVWAAYGTFMANGSFTLDEASPTSLTQPLGASGITLTFSFGATHFVVGDMFSFTVTAPRIYYKGKEAVRNLQFTVGSVLYPAVNRTQISGSFLTDTPEGRYGNWSADTSVNQGRFEIPDGLRYYIRNAYLSTSVNPIPSGSRLVTSDIFTMQARFSGMLNFNLVREETQIFSNPSEIGTDTAGNVTGTVGARYLTLDNNPVAILSFTEVATGDPLAYSHIVGTPYVMITEAGFGTANGDIEVIYQWRGLEPAPGQIYYITAKYLRPAEFYNVPFLFLSKNDTQTFLAPSTVRNDLYIGASICWDYNIPGLFVVQVKDADDDGLYSKEDFRLGINAFLQDRRATDLVVLNFFNSVPDQLQTINTANDPFQLHESMTWFGAPIGTPIGSEIEAGSLVFLSRKTFAVYGQSPAHGTRVLVGSTRCTRTITLEDKSSTSVTLDGSFIAAALASVNSAFTDPKETVLYKQITSFDNMQTYTNPENAILGGNNVIFFADESGGVYRIKEDITTDPFSPDTLNINQMVQKQFVTRDIRRVINNAMISMVFPSAETGVITLQAILSSRLSTLVGNNLIGEYQTGSGTVRDIEPDNDTVVFRDAADPTLFHIGYNYFLATTAKRVFGLYTVNLAGGFPK
jgi:hypothetical protein